MNGAHIVDRHMNPEQYYADPKDGRYLDGSLKTVRTVNKEDMTATQDQHPIGNYISKLPPTINVCLIKITV